jgi:hypothetical protein
MNIGGGYSDCKKPSCGGSSLRELWLDGIRRDGWNDGDRYEWYECVFLFIYGMSPSALGSRCWMRHGNGRTRGAGAYNNFEI